MIIYLSGPASQPRKDRTPRMSDRRCRLLFQQSRAENWALGKAASVRHAAEGVSARSRRKIQARFAKRSLCRSGASWLSRRGARWRGERCIEAPDTDVFRASSLILINQHSRRSSVPQPHYSLRILMLPDYTDTHTHIHTYSGWQKV